MTKFLPACLSIPIDPANQKVETISTFPPKKMSVKFLSVVFFASAFILLSACDSSQQTEDPIRVITASEEDIEFVKSQGWLEELMGQYIGGGIPCLKGNIDYKKCVRVDAALLPPLDPNNRDHFGVFYDPVKYYECRMKSPDHDLECWDYRMRRNEYEAVWPYPDVPPIKWPKPPEESGYRWWMSAERYYNHLCETEAGKFIYRTVDNVEGVYQIRPRRKAGDGALQDPYIVEDPYHQTEGEADDAAGTFVGPNHYQYLETSLFERSKAGWELRKAHPSMLKKPEPGDQYIYYFGYDRRSGKTMQKVFENELKSRYGYVWRGIKRPHDRENGIAGGELAVVDLASNEILGLWRGFLRSSIRSDGKVWWGGSQPCPRIPGPYGEEIFKFVASVLIPKPVLEQERVDD